MEHEYSQEWLPEHLDLVNAVLIIFHADTYVELFVFGFTDDRTLWRKRNDLRIRDFKKRRAATAAAAVAVRMASAVSVTVIAMLLPWVWKSFEESGTHSFVRGGGA